MTTRPATRVDGKLWFPPWWFTPQRIAPDRLRLVGTWPIVFRRAGDEAEA